MSFEITTILPKSVDFTAIALELAIPSTGSFSKVFPEFIFSKELLPTATAER